MPVTTPMQVLAENIGNLGPRDQSFAADLLDKGDRYGLTEKQAWWVRKLADRATGNEPGPVDIGGAELVAFFDRAASTLKYPKVKLSAGGEPLVLSRAGERSKTPGAVQVTDGGPFGSNVWYGRINRDGTFTESTRCTDEVRAVLKALARDPAGTAAAYGQRFGNCCFCRRELTDARSVSVGYGPVCADNYGLPWGEVADAA